jgi:hypothetical protein
MKFEIHFTTDNDSFHSERGMMETETAKMLDDIKDCVLDGVADGVVFDSNGNSIGTWGYIT